MAALEKYVNEIAAIFRSEADRYKAHEKATPVLKAMGADKEVLADILRKNLSDKDFISKQRHYPTLAFEIYQDENVGISGNCFMPLPDRSGDLSFQSIHHHGKLLLTTVAAFGPGYESLLFKRGYGVNKDDNTASMEVEKNYRFAEGSLEFVDQFQPHVVFFPEDVSITYAMWAYASINKTTQNLKNNPLVKIFKEPIRKMLKFTGLLNKAGVNAVENYDFYPENGKIKVLKNRINFELGTNENFLKNIFFVLQKTGFNDVAFLEKLKQQHSTNDTLHKFIDAYLAGEKMQDEFYDFHKNVRYVNLSKKEIMASLG